MTEPIATYQIGVLCSNCGNPSLISKKKGEPLDRQFDPCTYCGCNWVLERDPTWKPPKKS
jgi:hypothetical protein